MKEKLTGSTREVIVRALIAAVVAEIRSEDAAAASRGATPPDEREAKLPPKASKPRR
jgi:hypothetical protein